jgi:HKD family nuclease
VSAAAANILLLQPNGDVRLGDVLKKQLSDETAGWTTFRAAVAFAKRSGVQHLLPELVSFASRGQVKLSIGVDLRGTSQEALQLLISSLIPAGGEVWIFHNADYSRPTFHPKLYVLKKTDRALLIIGSGNMTAGGLFSNYEASVVLELDLKEASAQALLAEAESALDAWCDPTDRLAQLLTKEFFDKLIAAGMLPPEAAARGDSPAEGEAPKSNDKVTLFGKVGVKRAPRVGKKPSPPAPKLAGTGKYHGFLMLLQRTDVGVGQTTKGTSRRSPEIFIPLAALRQDERFWGWHLAKEDPEKPGKKDRRGVQMRLGGETIAVNIMTWPDKHDLRLRSEALRSAGKIGNILRIERASKGSGFEYYVEIVPQGTSQYAKWAALCATPVRNSQKKFGYY